MTTENMNSTSKAEQIPAEVVAELQALQINCDSLRAMLHGLSVAIADGGLQDLQCIAGGMWSAARALDDIGARLALIGAGAGANDD